MAPYTKKQKLDIFIHICSEIADKGRPLRRICRDPGTISTDTFYRWLKDPALSKLYTQATEERGAYLVEEMLEIADDQGGDVIVDNDGKEVTNWNVINRARLRVETRKWIASKLKPKKYGDSQLMKLANNEGDELRINAIFTTDLLENVLTNNSTTEDSET